MVLFWLLWVSLVVGGMVAGSWHTRPVRRLRRAFTRVPASALRPAMVHGPDVRGRRIARGDPPTPPEAFVRPGPFRLRR